MTAVPTSVTTSFGLVGLGKMGANMARRMALGGVRAALFDQSAEVTNALAAEINAPAAASLAKLVERVAGPRVIWLMLPAGDVTERAIGTLAPLLSEGDVIVDGANSFYKDSVRRAAMLKRNGLLYVDAGVSGGVHGLANGYCLMVGGEEQAVARIKPYLRLLAPQRSAAAGVPGSSLEGIPGGGSGGAPGRTPGGTPGGAAAAMADPVAEGSGAAGWLHAGAAGAGHFVKMVHNGIEYGMMQALAEGFALMGAKREFDLDLAAVGELWKHGSVVRSWLLDLTADALKADATLDGIKPFVPDSGEGRWTAIEAVELGVPAPVMSLALMMRYATQGNNDYAAKLLAKMRQGFGGHAVATHTDGVPLA